MSGTADLDSGPGDVADPERVVDRIENRGEEIKRRELEEAFARLDRELDPVERAILRRMADRIVGSLLAAPADTVERAKERDDAKAVRAAMRIFDPGEDVA